MNAEEIKKEAEYIQEIIIKKMESFKERRGKQIISPYVMGLDISKRKTGIAIINEETLEVLYYTYYEPASSDIKEIVMEYSFLIDFIFQKYNISKVVIEDTFMSNATPSVKDLNLVHGAILVNLIVRNVKIFKITTMSCKAFFGCGKIIKDERGKKIKDAKEVLFDEIKKRFNLDETLEFKNHNDITDAIALANCIKETKLIKKTKKESGIKVIVYSPVLKEY